MSAPGPTVAGMVSGAMIDLAAPDWRDIDLTDIAYGMAAIRRWNAQARRHVCDGRHSRSVMDRVAPRLKLPAILHDAHEAPWGDWIRPSVETLAQRIARRFGLHPEDVRDVVDGCKFSLDVAICRRVLASFGPATYPEGQSEETEAILLAHEMRCPEIRRADQVAASAEELDLGRGNGPRAVLVPEPPDDVEATLWLEAVRTACAERYGAPAHG